MTVVILIDVSKFSIVNTANVIYGTLSTLSNTAKCSVTIKKTGKQVNSGFFTVTSALRLLIRFSDWKFLGTFLRLISSVLLGSLSTKS